MVGLTFPIKHDPPIIGMFRCSTLRPVNQALVAADEGLSVASEVTWHDFGGGLERSPLFYPEFHGLFHHCGPINHWFPSLRPAILNPYFGGKKIRQGGGVG